MRRVSLIALICLSSSAAAQDETMAFPPAKVEIAVAELRNMAPRVEVSGSVVSLNDSRIAAEVEGVISWLANVGDAVDAGAIIARIDPRLTQIQLKRAQANVSRLEADLRYREQQLKRAEELAIKNNASANLVDESRANRDQALHLLMDARAQQDRARGDLDRTTIRAAFAGHVTDRYASVGEYVGIGDDVLRLVDTHRIEITLPAPIALTAFVKPGLEVPVKNDGIERRHTVRAVVPVGDIVSRMVEIRLSANDGDWLVGTPVQVRLPSAASADVVSIPRDALVERGGQAFIYKVTDAGTAEQINVSVQLTVGLWVGIADGIEPGDRVIVRGAERLAPGQAVEIIGPTNAN